MKEREEVLIFYRIFVGSLLIILVTLIMYLLPIRLPKLTDSFYGALLGAFISGGSAIIVFIFSERSKKRERIAKDIEIKEKVIKKLLYINKYVLKFIDDFNRNCVRPGLQPLSQSETERIESYIKRLKRLTEILETVEISELEGEILEEYFKYKLQILLIYDEMSRGLYLSDGVMIAHPNYLEKIKPYINALREDLSEFESYIKLHYKI